MRMRKKAWAQPELEASSFFVQHPEEQKGKWQQWFAQKQPIHLELGCGKGPFIAELAVKNPNINYIAIDISSNVLGVAKRNIESAYSAENRAVTNVAIMSFDIEQILLMMDSCDKVERIYINFCNPWPKGKHHKRRLTHTRQLEKYKVFLADKGEICFKTDDDDLYSATLRYFKESGFKILYETTDLHHSDSEMSKNNIMTEHEKMFTEQKVPIKAILAQVQKPTVSE